MKKDDGIHEAKLFDTNELGLNAVAGFGIEALLAILNHQFAAENDNVRAQQWVGKTFSITSNEHGHNMVVVLLKLFMSNSFGDSRAAQSWHDKMYSSHFSYLSHEDNAIFLAVGSDRTLVLGLSPIERRDGEIGLT
ncbi:hypothetical protein KIW84_075823 [Lathyrus oleraceus]|uniref:Uncharacterized protein n=1 Tax=Pisum sativum TaxID=3888 RepID=A0A9D5A1J1_PEA|nr:hypothetical protein KIW84_075823 [Pisum sativum]